MSDPSTTRPLVANRYELQRRVASGGMAELYLARDTVLDRPVAVKILFPQYASNAAFVERFRREAQSAGRLSHPNIAAVYDWGPYDETYYIAMEFVEGQTLADLLRADGPLLITEAGRIAGEVASALDLAHGRGLVHRDIKPSNIMITPSGRAKVTDFGIAQALGADNRLTEEGQVMGTAAYISPEQALGQSAELQSDLYSLGVVLFEMVTGRQPFVGSSPVAVAQQHVSEPPPLASTIRPSVSADLDSMIGRLMAKDPGDRYASSSELRADLDLLERNQPISPAPPTTRPAGDMDPTEVLDSAYMATSPAMAAAPPPTAAMPASAIRDFGATPSNRRYHDDDEEVRGRPRGGFLVVVAALVMVALVAAVFIVAQEFIGNTEGLPVSVPMVVGQTEAAATAAIVDADLLPIVRFEPSEDTEAGIVFAQDPAAQTELRAGDEVTIFVAAAAETVQVPNVLDKTAAEAIDELEQLGFVVSTSDEASDSVEVGRVLSQSIAAGEQANKGATISIAISTGVDTVQVPDLANLTQEAAENQLEDLGLRPRVEFVDVDIDADTVGRVVSQSPGPGQEIDTEGEVTIRIGRADTSSTTTTPTSSTTSVASTSSTTTATTTPSSTTPTTQATTSTTSAASSTTSGG